MRVLEPLVAAAALCCSSARAADWAVVLSGGASNAEAAAATRLSAELGDACGGGVALPIVADPADLAGRGALAVGRGAFESVTSAPAPDDDALGPQGYILDASSDGEWIGMAGGAAAGPGAHYAVEDFLQRLGARYYAPGVEVPPSCDYILPERVVVVPIFSMRSSYKEEVLVDDAWAAKLRHNFPALPAEYGGGIVYAGASMVHTANDLIPRETYFDDHPEWFWPPDPPDGNLGQLCYHHQDLVDQLVVNVLAVLETAAKDATIISVSQNDNHLYCQQKEELAINAAEGSQIGTLLRAVNAVADAAAAPFPHVQIDTLAYQYTQPAPTLTVPSPNVVIRLCSIEANFAEPLTGPSNTAFAKDIKDWAALAPNRLYIWDYTTDFYGYFQPFPNTRVLGPNIKFFREFGVVGVLEEDAYNTPGGDMGPLRAWLLAQLLWDPNLDADDLIDEFLSAYYGAPAVPALQDYIAVFEDSAAETGAYVTFAANASSAYLTPDAVLAGALAVEAAAGATVGDELKRTRVQTVGLGPLYVYLLRADEMAAAASGWPYPESLDDAFDLFAGWFNASGATGLDEDNDQLEWLHEQVFGDDQDDDGSATARRMPGDGQ